MATKVVMPKLGASMEEGTIVKWFIEEGEYIEEGDPLVEVLTDKINIEVEAETDGVLLKTLYDVEDVVKVQEVIAYIGDEGETIDESESSNEQLTTDDVRNDQIEENIDQLKNRQIERNIRRTPAARKLAKENHLSLVEIQGTGPNGRIQRADVEARLNLLEKPAKVTPLARKVADVNHIDLTHIDGTGTNGKIVRDDLLSLTIQKETSVDSDTVKKEPLSGMRKIIADRMSKSAFTSPHVTLTSEVDMINCVKIRKELIPFIEQINGHRLSFNEVIIKVVAHTLQYHPKMNISLENDEIIYHSEVNVGFAVAVPNGLVVPNVKKANTLGLAEITSECKKFSRLAREGKLLPEYMKNGTFTISNLGMYAVDAFTPIINQPEAAILGVGRIQEKPVVVNGEIAIKPMMVLSLSFDHRIIDGAPAAEFLTVLKENLENPIKLII
ncbi:dihydrolipoamide acetyltransferase component of pyruvate dehydrogenase complex [Heyndrickxia sporothermodurans]|nr:dihydrolipoamide acetyltransferase component of pyruvate dehydrogenase complex [Heyndrickxia sporothermodurans]